LLLFVAAAVAVVDVVVVVVVEAGHDERHVVKQINLGNLKPADRKESERLLWVLLL